MKVNGTLINYYFHCKRQCWLHGNRVNLESNSEEVNIGKAIHNIKTQDSKNAEVEIDNIKIDKITDEYVVEIKKSDSDVEAVTWQLLFYLKVLNDKGIYRKGKIEFIEKNKSENKIIYEELTPEKTLKLNEIVDNIETLLSKESPPDAIRDKRCGKCAYFEYCYI